CETLTTSMQAATLALTQELQGAGTNTLEQQRLVCETLTTSMQAATLALTQELQGAGANTLAQQRLVCDTLSTSMQTATVALTQELQASGAHTLEQQRLVCDTLSTSMQAATLALAEQLQLAGAANLAHQQAVGTTLANAVETITAQAQDGAAQTLAQTTQLLGSAEELMRLRMEAEAGWNAQQHARLEQLAQLLQRELGALNSAQEQRGNAAVDQLAALQGTVATHLGALGAGLEAPITRLVEIAAAAPRAATELISRLHAELDTIKLAQAARGDAAVERLAQLQEAVAGHLAALGAGIEAPIQRMIEAASQAPRAAAEVISRLHGELDSIRSAESARGAAAVDRLGELQSAVTAHLATLGAALEAPITRLIETASEAPRAAAEVIGQLRQEVASSTARDNDLLEERSRILETLNTLLDGINRASAEQRAVIDTLVTRSEAALNQAGVAFSDNVAGEAGKLAEVAAQVTTSAVDVASLGEAFGFAVQSFNQGNEKLIASLQRIEAAMDKSMARSDEQLAYYVAQAREIIDLSMMSQKEVLDALRVLPGQQARSKGSASAEVA
ncbi:MAG: hypothetical protein ACRYGK_00960, partial [Janthinobacterium lividum]